MSDIDEDLGSGLPNERTAMAWQRTALAFLASGALIAKQSGSMPVAAAVLVAVTAVVAWTLVQAERRYHRRGEAMLSGGPVVALHHVAAAGLTATLLAVVALAIVAG